MKKFMRTWLIVLVGGFILFGVFRYTINPQITASSFCKRSSTCLHGLILNDSSAAKLRYSADGRYLFGAGGGRVIWWVLLMLLFVAVGVDVADAAVFGGGGGGFADFCW